MTIGERKEYASRGELQKIIVSFFEGINEARVEFRNSEIANIKTFIDHIWNLYDSDNSGFIEAGETKIMLEDLTGIKNVDVEDCNKFLISIDKDKNGKIDREELSDFIFHGMLLSKEERLQYSQQGGLHDTIMQFFAGVDKARELFN